MKLYALEMVVVDDITKNDPNPKEVVVEVEMMTLGVALELIVEVEDGEDDFGGALEVGGCCCSDGDEEELIKARVLVKVKASLEK